MQTSEKHFQKLPFRSTEPVLTVRSAKFWRQLLALFCARVNLPVPKHLKRPKEIQQYLTLLFHKTWVCKVPDIHLRSVDMNVTCFPQRLDVKFLKTVVIDNANLFHWPSVHMPSLRILKLCRLPLSVLSDAFPHLLPMLHTLVVSQCFLTSFPNFSRHPHLQYLSLSGNRQTDFDGRCLPPTLKVLLLDNNPLPNIKIDLRHLKKLQLVDVFATEAQAVRRE